MDTGGYWLSSLIMIDINLILPAILQDKWRWWQFAYSSLCWNHHFLIFFVWSYLHSSAHQIPFMFVGLIQVPILVGLLSLLQIWTGHIPIFHIIFHHFPRVNTWSKPGQHVPSHPSDPGMQRQEPSPKVMQVLQVRPAEAPPNGQAPNDRPLDPSTQWDWHRDWPKAMTFLWHDEFCFWYWAMGYLGSFFLCTGSAGRLGDSPLTDYRCFCMFLPSRAPLIGDFLVPCLMSEG